MKKCSEVMTKDPVCCLPTLHQGKPEWLKDKLCGWGCSSADWR